jgi:predicted metal-dependent phosphoesterase TrpH
VWSSTGQQAVNGSPLQAALAPHQVLMVGGEPDADRLSEVEATVRAGIDAVDRARPAAVDGPTVVRELRWAARLALAGTTLLRRRAGDDVDLDAVRVELTDLADEHADRWLERSRPGGQADSERHLRRAVRALS